MICGYSSCRNPQIIQECCLYIHVHINIYIHTPVYIYIHTYTCTFTYTYTYTSTYTYNVKSGLINPSCLINPHCPKKKTGGPPGLINSLAYPRLINPQCWNSLFLTQNSLFPILFVSHRTSSAEIPCFQNYWFPILFFGGHEAENEPKWLKIFNLQCWNSLFFNQNYLLPILFVSHHSSSAEIPVFSIQKYLFPFLFVSHHVSPISEPWDFSNQISSNPIESCGIHEILAIKSHQTQWHLMGSMRFGQSNLIKPTWILWDSWDFSNQISLNPMESYEIHEILAIKSHQTQWNLMGSIGF